MASQTQEAMDLLREQENNHENHVDVGILGTPKPTRPHNLSENAKVEQLAWEWYDRELFRWARNNLRKFKNRQPSSTERERFQCLFYILWRCSLMSQTPRNQYLETLRIGDLQRLRNLSADFLLNVDTDLRETLHMVTGPAAEEVLRSIDHIHEEKYGRSIGQIFKMAPRWNWAILAEYQDDDGNFGTEASNLISEDAVKSSDDQHEYLQRISQRYGVAVEELEAEFARRRTAWTTYLEAVNEG